MSEQLTQDISNIISQYKMEVQKLESEKAEQEKQIIIYEERQRRLNDELQKEYGTTSLTDLENIKKNLEQEIEQLKEKYVELKNQPV